MLWIWLLLGFYLAMGGSLFVYLLAIACHQNPSVVRRRTVLASLALVCLCWPIFWLEIIR